jgi:hypothetical protein
MSNSAAFTTLANVIEVRESAGASTSPQLLGALKNAASDGRIYICKSPVGTPVGYMAWANVTKETLIGVNATKAMPSYHYEWAEGKLMLIFDVMFLPQWSKISKNHLVYFLRSKKFFAFIKRGYLCAWKRVKNSHKRYPF